MSGRNVTDRSPRGRKRATLREVAGGCVGGWLTRRWARFAERVRHRVTIPPARAHARCPARLKPLRPEGNPCQANRLVVVCTIKGEDRRPGRVLRHEGHEGNEAHEEGRGRAARSLALIVRTIGSPGPGPFMDFTLFMPSMLQDTAKPRVPRHPTYR